MPYRLKRAEKVVRWKANPHTVELFRWFAEKKGVPASRLIDEVVGEWFANHAREGRLPQAIAEQVHAQEILRRESAVKRVRLFIRVRDKALLHIRRLEKTELDESLRSELITRERAILEEAEAGLREVVRTAGRARRERGGGDDR